MSPRETRTLNYMINKGGITTLEANKELGNTRLSDSIFNLKKMGYHIKDYFIETTNRFGDACRVKYYYLANDNKQEDVA